MINSDELPAGFLVFCKCGHGLSMHTEPRELKNDNYIDSICRFDNGHYVCPCEGFQSETKKTTTTLTATNGLDKQQFEKVAVEENNSNKKDN